MSTIRQSVAEIVQHAKTISTNVKAIINLSVQIATLKLIQKLPAKYHAWLFRALLKKAISAQAQGVTL